MRRTSRLAPAVTLVAMATVGAGCEYFRDTPEQELADRRWRVRAEGLRDVTLDRVDADGRIHFTYIALNQRDRVLRCLETATRSGPPLPEPAAEALAGR